MRPFVDRTGHRYGRLTVIEKSTRRGSGAIWVCRCDCGSVTEVRSDGLQSGGTKSCGCLHRELVATNGKTHGASKTRTYRSWRAMRKRCYDVNTKEYYRYGGKGIAVCARWRDSFENFLADMGERPAGKTLDRFPERTGNYEPGNCRWATPREQSSNTLQNKLLTFNGVTLHHAEWERRAGLALGAAHLRIRRLGWTVEEAYSIPKGVRRLRIAGDS